MDITKAKIVPVDNTSREKKVEKLTVLQSGSKQSIFQLLELQ